MKKSIRDLDNIKGKRALVRVDMNTPLTEDKVVSDDTRIRAILPTIKLLKEKGAKIILMAHLGRPKGEKNPEFSLAPVAKRLAELLGEPVMFLNDCVGEEVKSKLSELKDGEVALLENIRFYKAEEAKDDDMTFAKELAESGDFYVNDAFGAAHRNHSSTAKIAKILKPAVSGLLMEKELASLGKALDNPIRPFTAIVGGAKVSTKIGVLENLVDKVDNLIIGGGMAYTFVKANGGKIGNSICEDDQMDVAKAIEKKAAEKGVKIIMAKDVLITNDFSGNGENKFTDVTEIPDGFEGVDAGPETRKEFAEVIKNSKTILWNGPVGAFENDKFTEGTKSVAQAVAEATKIGAVSVLGGGDTVAAVKKYAMDESLFTHISTGGGASLEFIEGKVLPGVAALDDK
ncbi:MAG: phosphoglycerate kinase [Candidatus Gastranaerophilales bacterium]|nr:phosphoglycerate kinase [Candidatus Gastranaerophilales bacterium]